MFTFIETFKSCNQILLWLTRDIVNSAYQQYCHSFLSMEIFIKFRHMHVSRNCDLG